MSYQKRLVERKHTGGRSKPFVQGPNPKRDKQVLAGRQKFFKLLLRSPGFKESYSQQMGGYVPERKKRAGLVYKAGKFISKCRPVTGINPRG